jgi:predicted flap endonuclease-1-like 5' DNA nuclease
VFGDSTAVMAADADAVGEAPVWDIDVRAYETHDRVEHYVELFSSKAKERFASRLSRGTRYEPMIRSKLRASGIADTAALLAKTSKPKDREALAAITGISGKLILKFANRADLMRVNGVGEEYADLLEAAGVDTVPELAQRKAQNLFEALTKTNMEKKLVRQTPSLAAVKSWIAAAKDMPRVLQY